MSASSFEVHMARLRGEALEPSDLPWHSADDTAREFLEPPFVVADHPGEAGAVDWAAVDAATGGLVRVQDPAAADFGLRITRLARGGRLRSYLALLSRAEVLVNGLPAIGLTLLSARDSLVPAPGRIAYITERASPYVGTALAAHLKKRCPYCRLEIDAAARIASCSHCETPYHLEDEVSHPGTPAADRLQCFAKVRNCLVCRRPLTLDSQLVWDPRVMS
jgi:hypothetical protein